jgi:hypothetical protein
MHWRSNANQTRINRQVLAIQVLTAAGKLPEGGASSGFKSRNMPGQSCYSRCSQRIGGMSLGISFGPTLSHSMSNEPR